MKLWKIGWVEINAIWHSGRVAPIMCTVDEGAVCTSPTENSYFGGGYKVTTETRGGICGVAV